MANKRILRTATWNIHMGIGLDGRRDLNRIAQVIAQMDPDLIGLQEVDNHVDRKGNDLERLRDMTRMSVVAGPTMQRDAGDYGNALLTRLPVAKVEHYDISVKRREPRGILVAHLDWFGEPLRVAVTHFGLRAYERRWQMRRLVECLSVGNESPIILLGDLNEWLSWGRPLRWLRRHFGSSRCPATFPARLPVLRLDHILADPPQRLHPPFAFRSSLAQIASDHLPLVAVFTR